MNRPNWQRALAAVALTSAGVIAGANMSSTNVAQGETTPAPPPRAFESGGQMSVPILRDISSTLHQMDARLARLETVAQKLRSTPARRSISEDVGDPGATN